MAIVPDGVARVVLRDFAITQPHGATPGNVPDADARVRSNVALFEIHGLTMAALHLSPASLGRYVSQVSARECMLTHAVYAIPATPQMVWLNAAGATLRAQRIHMPLYVATNHPPQDARPTPAVQRCQARPR